MLELIVTSHTEFGWCKVARSSTSVWLKLCVSIIDIDGRSSTVSVASAVSTVLEVASLLLASSEFGSMVDVICSVLFSSTSN